MIFTSNSEAAGPEATHTAVHEKVIDGEEAPGRRLSQGRGFRVHHGVAVPGALSRFGGQVNCVVKSAQMSP
jgi:hypothetical protein